MRFLEHEALNAKLGQGGYEYTAAAYPIGFSDGPYMAVIGLTLDESDDPTTTTVVLRQGGKPGETTVYIPHGEIIYGHWDVVAFAADMVAIIYKG